MTRKSLYIWILLLSVWAVYTGFLIVKGAEKHEVILDRSAASGKRIWQQHNCSSCHQLYGLGGYLGPDLTNVYHRGGEAYIRAMIKSGTAVMPAFDLPDHEIEDVVAFLKTIDRTGNADPANYIVKPDGMIAP